MLESAIQKSAFHLYNECLEYMRSVYQPNKNSVLGLESSIQAIGYLNIPLYNSRVPHADTSWNTASSYCDFGNTNSNQTKVPTLLSATYPTCNILPNCLDSEGPKPSALEFQPPEFSLAGNETLNKQSYVIKWLQEQDLETKKNIQNGGRRIKKPLNAFMLYMKDTRAKVIAESSFVRCADVNQIIAHRWHRLTDEEQAKYYKMSERECELHKQLYPLWKPPMRRQKKISMNTDKNGQTCKVRFGLERNNWCRPCRQKKKCLRNATIQDLNNNNLKSRGIGSNSRVEDLIDIETIE